MQQRSYPLTPWFFFVLLAIASVLIWGKFSYPQFAFINSSVNRTKALSIATSYLKDQRNIDTSRYKTAVVSIYESGADRYLQKTLKSEGELAFFREHNFELFFWLIRFFKEDQKEEFRIAVSASSGEITSFSHSIDDTERRDFIEKSAAQRLAADFLREKFKFDPKDYTVKGELSKLYDNRTDYSFSWQKNDVSIPWSAQPDTGSAKLLIGATVTGGEILTFFKRNLEIPDKFNRFVEKQENIGHILSLLFSVIYLALVIIAIFYVILRRNHLVMHSVKPFMICLTAGLFFFNLCDYFNRFQSVLFSYPTASPFASYLWQVFTQTAVNTLLATAIVLMPGLAGESIRHEVFPDKQKSSFLHYAASTFFSRNVAQMVLLGYLVFIILVGMQTLALQIGYRYLGVWVEKMWLAQLSTNYLPFLAAFIIGIRASFTEEILFRVFTTSWIKKVAKNTIVAVVLTSLIWGYGHSHYLVFPMWFRGLEVTCLGLLLSYVFLRYGIIPVLVAHYLFDVFWSTASFLLGKTDPFNFYSSLAVFLLPLLWGMTAFGLNRLENERELFWRLNKHQIYNLGILKNYLMREQESGQKTKEELRRELIAHNWDMAVVDQALGATEKTHDA